MSPNPVSASTEIQLYLEKTTHVNISVVNILGQVVTLFNDLNFSQGENSVTWNAGNFPTGIYFIKVNNGGHLLTRKILVIH